MVSENSFKNRRVAKKFWADEDDPSSNKIFYGTVIGKFRGKRDDDDREEVDLYQVEYDDGDEEDMELSELRLHLMHMGGDDDDASSSSSTTLGSKLRNDDRKKDQGLFAFARKDDSESEEHIDANEDKDGDFVDKSGGAESLSSDSESESESEEVAKERQQPNILKRKATTQHTAPPIRRLQSPGGQRLTWDERFDELVQFKDTYGDTNVPQNWADNTTLANWVQKQKQAFKDLLCNKRTAIFEDQIEKLRSIGFNWGDVYSGNWNRRCKELLEHIKSGGSNSVDTDKMNPVLRGWFYLQRELLREHRMTGVVHMDFMEENYNLLSEIPGIIEEESTEEVAEPSEQS